MKLILKITSTKPGAPLSDVLRLPIGLDIWEAKPDYVVLRASEAQADRLQRMGYAVEQLHETDRYVRVHICHCRSGCGVPFGSDLGARPATIRRKSARDRRDQGSRAQLGE